MYTVPAVGRVACCKLTASDEDDPILAVAVDKVVTLFNGSRPLTELQGLTTAASALGLDRHARRAAAGTHGGSLRLWDVATGEAIQGFASCHRTTITCVDYHPFAEFMATSSRDTHVRVWDLRKKGCLQVYKHKTSAVAASIEVVRMTPDGLMAASGDADGIVRLYDLRGGKELHQFARHHDAPITSLAFHPTLQMLTSVSADGVVANWDIEERKLIMSKDQTQCTHAALVEGFLVAAGPACWKRWSIPEHRECPAKSLSAGECIGAMATSATGRVIAAGINGSCVNVSSLETRASQKGRTDAKPARANTQSAPTKQPSAPPVVLVSPTTSKGPTSPVSRAPKASASPTAPTAPTPTAAVNVPAPGGVSAQPPTSVSPRVDGHAGHSSASPVKQRLPAATVQRSPASASASAPMAQELDDMFRRGDTLQIMMQRRATHTRMIREMFQRNPKDAFDYARELVDSDQPADTGSAVDLVDTVGTKLRATERVSLESLAAIIGLCVAILSRHSQSRFPAVALEACRVLWSRWRQQIMATVRQTKAVGVDLTQEARREHCRDALEQFEFVKIAAEKLAQRDCDARDAANRFLAAYAAAG
jgi:WD40 repeat protein